MAQSSTRLSERCLRGAAAPLRAALLAWYDAHHRDVPWRTAPGETPDPYRVWVSEIMLQQTRVETARGRYAEWLERFPTLATLAEAEPDEVMKAWEGLGYYARARNLHRAVREVAADYGGKVPDDPAVFRSLPGVGRYTAGAVASIAFEREEPVVDGNVRRVFARWADTAEPAERELWRLASELVEGERPGDLNQALMELGAVVCTPRSPGCGVCPVSHHCLAFARGTQEERPARRQAKPLPREDTAVAVVERDDRLLLVRRPRNGRLGGMWGFPEAVRHDGEAAHETAERAALDGVGLSVRAGPPIATVEHTFTHVRVTYRAFRCVANGGEPRPLRYDACAWADAGEVADYALPTAQRRIARLALPES